MSDSSPNCGPVDLHKPLFQYFRAPEDYLSGISIRLGTYRRVNHHNILLNIKEVLENENSSESSSDSLAAIIHKWELSASDVYDGDYINLYFPTIKNSRDRQFLLSMSSSDGIAGEVVTAWLSSTDTRIPGHIHFFSGYADFDEGFGLEARLITSNPDSSTNYPEGLLYSPLSSCNMNCIHCISQDTRKRAVRMPEDIKEDIRNHAWSGDLKYIFTDYSGDILFADKKKNELDFLFSLGVAIHIDTNGAYLDDAMVERVMNSPVDAVSISVDAARDSTYRKIRVGSPPVDTIFAAAKALVEARIRHGKENTFEIKLGFTLMNSNIHELPLFISRAADIGIDTVGCRHLEVYSNSMESESLYIDIDYANSLLEASRLLAERLGIELQAPSGMWERKTNSGPEPCGIPWSSAVILANGDLMACCVPGSKMGNIHEQSVEQIWQGEAYRQLRRRVNSVSPPSLCKSCQFRNINMAGYNNQADVSARRHAAPLLQDLMREII